MIGVRRIPGIGTEIETETVIIVEMGGGMTIMTEREEEKDMGVQLGKAVRNEGLGLKNGIERGRRNSNLKRECCFGWTRSGDVCWHFSPIGNDSRL